MSQMTGTPSSIKYGPCQVTYDGNELGYFKGGVVATYTQTWYDITSDQSTSMVDSKIQAEAMVVTVPMQETDLAKLTLVMPTGTYVLDSGLVKKKISVGGGQASSSDFKQLIVNPLSDGSGTLDTTVNERLTLYKAVPKLLYSKTYTLDGEVIIPVEFHAVKDTTKDAGEDLFLLGDSTATA